MRGRKIADGPPPLSGARAVLLKPGAKIAGWGSTVSERDLTLPCDALVPDALPVLFRAVDVAAPPGLVFRWLCQLRVAPYSYDRIDNLGRRSPQHLIEGLDLLERGVRFMTIFRLADFEPSSHLTLEHRGHVFGHVGVTYRVTAVGRDSSRLLLKLAWRPPELPVGGGLLALALSAGDLVMSRRQLLNLRGLAERDAVAGLGGSL